MEYRVFDCFEIKNKKSFEDRDKLLKKIFKKKNKKISYIETVLVNNIDEFENKFNQYLTEGYEGIMARNRKSFYELSKRSSNLQKHKKFIDSEFKIVGYEEGSGTDKGTVIWKCVSKTNQVFNVRPVGDCDYRKKLLEDAEKYVGQFLTVKYQELSKKGVPRFPVGKNVRLVDK